MGKSRLAVEVAAASRAEFPGGAWLVELAPLTQPGLVLSAIAEAFGIRERPRTPLLELLAGRLGASAGSGTAAPGFPPEAAGTLLVLDNCEHLLDQVASVADQLLRRCAGLRILATSRERLGLTGEAAWPVSGLGVPAPAAAGVHAIGRGDAVRLLVERAAAVRPGFSLTEATAGMAAEICRRLDGMPLALELAAAGVQVWGVERVAERLDSPLAILTRGSRVAPPRHQTIRAAVDWSYGLLDARQRRLFDRLAVFAGGFTVEAAEAIDGGPDAAEALARLVDKSMVMIERSGDGSVRYRMPESLRAYGRERLDEAGLTASVRDRHAAYVLATAASARRGLRGAWRVGRSMPASRALTAAMRDL